MTLPAPAALRSLAALALARAAVLLVRATVAAVLALPFAAVLVYVTR